MDKETFIKKAQEICRASFIAYFVENNFPKSCKDMPTERFKSFCTDKLHSCVNYEAFMDYLMPTDCYEKSAIAENIEIHVPFATDELCVILLTADINYLVDNGYVMQFHCRTSYVVVQRQGKLEILHLHFAIPHKSIRNTHLHGQQECTNLHISSPINNPLHGAATAAGMYSPNGLIFYQISGKERVGLVNASLLQLLGYASNKDLFECTQGKLEKLVIPEDWTLVRRHLAKREPGSIFTINATFMRKDGSAVKVLLRGNYVENHNHFFILSLTPLLVPDEELSYGDFTEEEKYAEDYSIPYELFLKIALDIFVQYGREKGIPHLLELCTAVLNAHNGWICDARELNKPLQLLFFNTAPGYKKLLPINMPSRCCLYHCHAYNTNAFNSLAKTPKPLQSIVRSLDIASWMHSIITLDGKESFILFFLRQKEDKPWTENEQKIMHYASKMFALLLKGYVQKHPSPDYVSGGVP